MGRSTDKETRLSEQRKQYRSWTAQQKIEIVLAGLRGDRSVKDVCREHEISDTLFYSWRDKLLEGGREALAGKEERAVIAVAHAILEISYHMFQSGELYRDLGDDFFDRRDNERATQRHLRALERLG